MPQTYWPSERGASRARPAPKPGESCELRLQILPAVKSARDDSVYVVAHRAEIETGRVKHEVSRVNTILKATIAHG
jgi:hypothetical protein